VGSLAFHANLLVVLQHAPLTIEVFGSGAPGTPLLVLNRGQRSYLEHRRKKDAPAGGEAAATPVPKERRVLHWDEAGKAVYEDEGEEEEDEIEEDEEVTGYGENDDDFVYEEDQ
jgi:hypothetical protein